MSAVVLFVELNSDIVRSGHRFSTLLFHPTHVVGGKLDHKNWIHLPSC